MIALSGSFEDPAEEEWVDDKREKAWDQKEEEGGIRNVFEVFPNVTVDMAVMVIRFGPVSAGEGCAKDHEDPGEV